MKSTNPILFCFALRAEANPFRRRTRGMSHARVLVTGMGRTNVAASLNTWLSRERPDQVLSCGFAGGLDPALAVGEVLFEAEAPNPLRSRLLAAGAREGRFHCADTVAVTAGEKQKLRAVTGAEAVEMESWAIWEICRRVGLPVATVRVISDAAGEDLPLDFNRVLGLSGRIDYAQLALLTARRPAALIEMLQWHRRLRRAARVLGDFLALIIRG